MSPAGRRQRAARVIAAVALSVARLAFTTESASAVAGNGVGWIGAALFLGWAVASRRAYVAEIRDRAERAERTREEEARRRVDAERLRIARELHDVVAHSIATINVQAGVAAHVADRQPERSAEALAAIKELSKKALGELRAILDVLRAVDDPESRAPTPGLAQLDTLIASTAQAGVRAELRVEGEPAPLPAAVDLAAYRIAQEALTNVVRHAGTAAASVSIGYRPGRVVVSVEDDGAGEPDREAFVDGAGHGITGMRERAESLGGSLDAGPRPGGGFCVSASLPVEPAAP